jgi:ferredoxin-NADP reductase
LEFGARISSSPWKRAFQALKPDDTVEIDGPYGHFVLDQTRDAVFVAGGIGITPLKGMLEFATDRRLPVKAVMLFSNRQVSEIAYRDELQTLAKTNPNVRLINTITRADDAWNGPRGRIDARMLQDASSGLREPNYYICGLPEMVRDVAILLMGQLGVPRDRIVAEQFWGYE